MVLSGASGGAQRRRVPRTRDERGSQTVELALTLPFVVLVLVLMLHAGVLVTDLVAATSVASQAARIATVDDDAAVHSAVRTAVGRRRVDVELDPPDTRRRAGDDVTATVRLQSRAFEPFGATLWVPARAVMRVERP